MTTGYPAAQPSAGTRLLACVGTLFYLIGSHLLLPAPVQGTVQLCGCPKLCWTYRLPAVSALLSRVPIAASVNQ